DRSGPISGGGCCQRPRVVEPVLARGARGMGHSRVGGWCDRVVRVAGAANCSLPTPSEERGTCACGSRGSRKPPGRSTWNPPPADGEAGDRDRFAHALGLGAGCGGAVPARTARPALAGSTRHTAGPRTGPLPAPRPLGAGAGVRRHGTLLVAPRGLA